MVAEAEWNALSKFYSADQDITVKRDLQSNTLTTEPGEYLYVRQLQPAEYCCVRQAAFSQNHRIIFPAYGIEH